MIKKNQLVMMLALLSATPHLTLWAVESTQETKNVSATKFKVNDDDFTEFAEIAKQLERDLFNQIDKLQTWDCKDAKKHPGTYTRPILLMDAISQLAHGLKKAVSEKLPLLLETDGNTKDIERIQCIQRILSLLEPVTSEISDFNKWLAKDAYSTYSKCNHIIQIQPQDDPYKEWYSLEDKEFYIEMCDILLNISLIDVEHLKNLSVLDDKKDVSHPQEAPLKIDHLKCNLKKMITIRENVMTSDTPNHKKYKSYNLATDEISKYCKKFQYIFRSPSMVENFNIYAKK